MMDDIVGEKRHSQENQRAHKDGVHEERQTHLPLYSDQGSGAAGGVDGAGDVHEEGCQPHGQGDGHRTGTDAGHHCHSCGSRDQVPPYNIAGLGQGGLGSAEKKYRRSAERTDQERMTRDAGHGQNGEDPCSTAQKSPDRIFEGKGWGRVP